MGALSFGSVDVLSLLHNVKIAASAPAQAEALELSMAAESILPCNSTALNPDSWRQTVVILRDSGPVCLDLRSALTLSRLSPMTSRVHYRITNFFACRSSLATS